MRTPAASSGAAFSRTASGSSASGSCRRYALLTIDNRVATLTLNRDEMLRSERASINAKLEGIARKLDRLAEAERAEEDVFAEIAKLGEKEIEASYGLGSRRWDRPHFSPPLFFRAQSHDSSSRSTDDSCAAKALGRQGLRIDAIGRLSGEERRLLSIFGVFGSAPFLLSI
jgi:hypothetical protein